MESRISDPNPLATYSTTSGASTSHSAVWTSFTPIQNSESGWATTTVQGDGIHIIDLASLQPIASHTLGPSVFYSAPALTIVRPTQQSDAGKSIRRRKTYAPIASGSSSSSEKSQEIWSWEDSPGSVSSSASKPKKTSIPHDVTRLLPSPSGDHLFVFASDGRVSCLSTTDDSIIDALPSPPLVSEEAPSFWKCLIHSRSRCTFLPVTIPNGTTIIVRFFHVQGESRMTFDWCDAKGAMFSGGLSVVLPLDASVEDISLNFDGEISCLTSSGEWKYFTLHPSSSQSSTGFASALTLQAPTGTFLPTILSPSSASIIPLTSSHVLIASIASSSSSSGAARKSKLELAIWDLRYGVRLAEFSAGLPGSGSGDSTADEGPSSSSTRQLRLVSAGSGYALLSITPAPVSPPKQKQKQKDKKGQSLSSSLSHILLIPYRVPKQSTLAATLLSRRSNTSPLSASLLPQAGAAVLSSPEQESLKRQVVILDILRDASASASAKGMQLAVGKWWDWVDEESVIQQMDEKDKDEDAMDVDSKRVRAPNRKTVHISHTLVSRVLSLYASIPHQTVPAWTSMRPLIRYLIMERQLVTNGMLEGEGGVLRVLIDRGDWELVKHTLRSVPDLPEFELIRALRIIILQSSPPPSSHLSTSTPSEYKTVTLPQSAFPWSAVPSLNEFMVLLLAYPLEPAHVRTALKSHFGDDVDSVLPLFGWCAERIRGSTSASGEGDWFYLESWRADVYLDRRGKRIEGVGRDKATDGFVVQKTSGGEASLDSILAFLEILLDSSFLALMQQPTSQSQSLSLLTSLSRTLKPQADLTVRLVEIEPFLAPFAREEEERARNQKNRNGSEEMAEEQERSVARRHAKERNAVVGLYQLEELEL